MLMRVRTTGNFTTRDITTKKGDSMTLTFEQCDLYLPGKRHPVDHDRKVDNQHQGLQFGVNYFIAGESFGVNNYGTPEIKRYDMQYITEDQLLAFLDTVNGSVDNHLSEVG